MRLDSKHSRMSHSAKAKTCHPTYCRVSSVIGVSMCNQVAHLLFKDDSYSTVYLLKESMTQSKTKKQAVLQ